jgi:hypothetical protein
MNQSRRRNCSLDNTMLLNLESLDYKPDWTQNDEDYQYPDTRLSIFKTIIPEQYSLTNLNKNTPRKNLFDLKASGIYPSLLSTALDTTVGGSERMTLRATINDKKHGLR